MTIVGEGREGEEYLLYMLKTKFFVLNWKTQGKMELIKTKYPELYQRIKHPLFRWILQMKVKKILSLRIFRHKLKLLLLYR